jgi:hypothetical protein
LIEVKYCLHGDIPLSSLLVEPRSTITKKGEEMWKYNMEERRSMSFFYLFPGKESFLLLAGL